MQFKNRNQIIKDAANYEGGTHYLDETPHIVETIRKEKVGELDNLTVTLLNIAELVFYLGHVLLIEHEYRTTNQLVVLTEEAKQTKLLALEDRKKEHIKDFINMGKFSFIAEGFSE